MATEFEAFIRECEGKLNDRRFDNVARFIESMCLAHIEFEHGNKDINYLKRRHIEMASSFYFEGQLLNDRDMETKFKKMLIQGLADRWEEDGVNDWLDDESDEDKWIVYPDLPTDWITGKAILTNNPETEMECTKFCIVLYKTWYKVGTPIKLATAFPYPLGYEPIINDDETDCF